MKLYLLTIFLSVVIKCVITDDSDFNTVNQDGSFSFGLSNNDVGRHSHSASGSPAPNGVVRGRYASRNPATGLVDETVYTAGPRGFRARGPNIHRKMDLSQIPRGPIGNKDDSLADPYDEPTYGFQFRTPDYKRREDADREGTVRGLYSFVDDAGEKHVVRYAAGKDTGFEIYNSIPDSALNTRYNAPLYKATSRKARGRHAVERGPPGQYRFIMSAPDQRRSESADSQGVVRGSYSYLDDKGVQRTVEYIAGAGIGYRVVKTTVGPLTHVLPAPVVPEFGLRGPVTNELSDADIGNKNDDSPSLSTAASGNARPYGTRPYNNRNQNEGAGGGGLNKFVGRENDDDDSDIPLTTENKIPNIRPANEYGARRRPANRRPGNKNRNFNKNKNKNNQDDKKPDGENDSREIFPTTESSTGYPPRNRPGFPELDSVNFLDNANNNNKNDPLDPNNLNNNDNNINTGENNLDNIPPPKGPITTRDSDENYNDRFPEVSLDGTTETDDKGNTDGTLIKNVGDIYVGLPPGASVRAHVQSIDLVPLDARAPSPAEAFKRESESYL